MQRHGYATIVEPDQRTKEFDTVGCGHCQRVIFVKPGTAATVYLIPRLNQPWGEHPGAFCRICIRAVCLKCHSIGSCTPFERRLERAEARDRFVRRALGLN